MLCTWKADSSWSPDTTPAARWRYGLWVISSDGTADRVATWSAGPGDVVRTTDSTAIPADHITRIDQNPVALRRAGNGPSAITGLLEATAQMFGHGGDVARRPATGDYRRITERRAAFQIHGDDIFRLVVIQRCQDSSQ